MKSCSNSMMYKYNEQVNIRGLHEYVDSTYSQHYSQGNFQATEFIIDGGHGIEPARLDYELWTPLVAPGGTLAIHDVFPDPADGGRPPYEQIYVPALASGLFTEVSATGSLRVLRRTS